MKELVTYDVAIFQAPEVVSLYALNVSPAFIRHHVRRRFEENRYVSDPRVIDMLVQKGRQEYQETLNCWKQTDHILGILLENKQRAPRTFLQKFYEGMLCPCAFMFDLRLIVFVLHQVATRMRYCLPRVGSTSMYRYLSFKALCVIHCIGSL